MTVRLREAVVARAARAVNLHLETHSPGDGATRYSLFLRLDGSRPLTRQLGSHDALIWLEGYQEGITLTGRCCRPER